MSHFTPAYIGLGSNSGDRKGFIRKALKMLAGAEHIELSRVSDIIETAPLGRANQPKYLNAVAEIKTTLKPKGLHRTLADIETSLGRTRNKKWSPRTIDLDLLLFGTSVINSPRLTIPHPQIHLRSFVLKGLCRLNAKLLHPVMNESVGELAARLGGADYMLNPASPQLVNIAGIIGVGKTTLTKKLSNRLGCKAIFEAYDTNPFMPDVYAGKKELALDSQLYFLTSRTSQLNIFALEPGQIVISDYVFDKERIYAGELLNPRQLALYEQIYPPFAARISVPVLVIYLIDSAENCLKRIHKRNRPYERKIQHRFLEALSTDYEQLFSDWKTCPVIRITMSKFDHTKKTDIEHLAYQIRNYVAVK